MAWIVKGDCLSIAEGDYGLALPVAISGAEIGDNDTLKITLKDSQNGTLVLEKTLTVTTKSTAEIEFTAAESALFSVGEYVYSLDWYQDGAFLCNLIPCAKFRVVDKA